jgi:hypothetical protein
MFGTPVVASRREPVRTIRLPEGVRLAIIDMVELGDDFIAAGKRHGVKAQVMRRWLGRAECISFLRKERSRFRQTVCAQNEAILAEIRDDRDGNQMARVRAVQVLEQLDETPAHRAGDAGNSRGIVLNIIHATPTAPTIDITPQAAVSSHGLPNSDE